ncbi:MAG: trigger factor [Desulfobacteraceae bacterium]|jgi:trigger factor
MKTSLEEISPVKKKLIIEVEAEEVDKKLDKAYSRLGKKAKIRGFRPGKVPRKILERYFGDQVVEDVARNLVTETLPKAVEETQTYPLSMPMVENETLRVGQNFKYAAIMEVKPIFELKDYEGIEVEREMLSVTDEDVDKQLEEIRKANGQLKPVGEDRGVQEDDYVVLEYEGFEGGKPLDGIKADNFLLRVGSDEFHPEFEKRLVGLKVGDNTEIEVDFEENTFHNKLAGKSVHFKVKVSGIKLMELPELNDEFAASLGADFSDLETLKKKIKEDLTTKEEKRIDAELKERLLKKISETVSFELPESLVDTEIRYGIENVKQNLIRIGSSIEKAGLTEEKLKEDLRPASEKRVKDLLILGEIAKQNDLNINESELSEGFSEMAEKSGQDPQVLRRYYEAKQLVDAFRERLLEEKTLNYLVKAAKIKEVAAAQMNRERG